jgi:hypothetical protein
MAGVKTAQNADKVLEAMHECYMLSEALYREEGSCGGPLLGDGSNVQYLSTAKRSRNLKVAPVP